MFRRGVLQLTILAGMPRLKRLHIPLQNESSPALRRINMEKADFEFNKIDADA